MSAILPHNGKLKESDLTQILMQLYEERTTGSLILQNNETVKIIYIKEGNIVFATSNHPGDRLGEVLLRLGKISAEQFHLSVDLLKATGKQQGTILVEEGLISAKDLFEGLKDQVRETLFSLFLWDEGTYHFIQEELPKQAIPLPIDMVQLISHILQRIEMRAAPPSLGPGR